jgi:hypothetical protein
VAAPLQSSASSFIPRDHSKAARAQAHPTDVHGFIYDDSVSPAAVAQVADVAVPAFSPPQTLGQLARLSSTAFFEVWSEAAYSRRNVTLREGSEVTRQVIGTVFEGDSLAHVVYRPGRWHPVNSMPLSWSSRGWFLLLNDDISWIGDLDWLLEAHRGAVA